MIILQDIVTEQTFSFIPKKKPYDTMTITDDQTNKEVAVPITAYLEGDYYDTITAVFGLVENHVYNLVLKYGSDIVYKDKIFCTNQPVATYSINNGKFVSKPSNNEFIVYE